MTYFLLKAMYRFLHVIPLAAALWIGRVIGFCFYLNRRKRNTAFINVKQAFPEKSNRELFYILRRSFISFGMNIIETFLGDKVKERVRKEWTDQLAERGEIFVGIHQGNWESYHAVVASEAPLTLLVGRQKNRSLDRFLNELRRAHRVKPCYTLKEVIAAVKKDIWVGLVVDHGAEENAKTAEFFGHLVPTPGGAVTLAKRFHKRIFPTFGYRSGREHVFIIADPVCCDEQTPDEELLGTINRRYEDFLRRHPYDYMWWFKRFKRKQNRKILVLSDGKAGHLKQSLIVADSIAQSGYRTEYDVVEIAYRNKFTRCIVEALSVFAGRHCLGNTRGLRFFLSKEVFDKLQGRFYDIVISTGSSPAAANVLYARACGARSCVILKPNVPLSRFDVAIIPEHDGVDGENVVVTKGALARQQYDPDLIETGRKHFRLSQKEKVCLCVGNALEDEKTYRANVREFAARLKQFVSEQNYGILITTSRRTSKDVEALVREEFAGFEHTEALVIASGENYPFVIPTFLSESNIVFVSAESVSMISESLYLDKTTVAVVFEELTSKTHRRFLHSLESDYVNVFHAPYGRFDFRRPSGSLKEENENRLQKALRKIL